ncbi:perlwapin [Penaeus vannamei]|uniref:SWD5 n=1 Tax=Penaeus vannamei TaxID=6689 RepID=A0A6B9P6X5_PENVA|nr:SWD5 [Penaeus vannamei]
MASLRLILCAAFTVVLMAAVEVRSEAFICEVNYPKIGKCPSHLSIENYPAAPSPPDCACSHDRDCPGNQLCCEGQGGFRSACYEPEA